MPSKRELKNKLKKYAWKTYLENIIENKIEKVKLEKKQIYLLLKI